MTSTARRTSLIILALLLAATPWLLPLAAAEPKDMAVSLDMRSRYHLQLGGAEVAMYFTDPSWAKPFLWPLIAPNGLRLTRAWPIEPTPLVSRDHVHQKSAWFTHGEVTLESPGGERSKPVDVWAEMPGHGKIVLINADLPAKGRPLVATYQWQGPNGQKMLAESRTVSLYDVAPGRLIVIDIDLQAAFGPVVFGDTKEGSFGVRIHDQLRVGEKGKINPKSRITNAEGKEGEKACWGYPSNWCDCSGEIDGQAAGIAVFDDPTNKPRSCWHVRDYGLMAANPFGRQKSGFPAMHGRTDVVRLGKDEHLKLRYGIYLHDGDRAAGKVAEAFARFAKLKN
jgi:hypothetical protein